jgi:hypothetical protein
MVAADRTPAGSDLAVTSAREHLRLAVLKVGLSNAIEDSAKVGEVAEAHAVGRVDYGPAGAQQKILAIPSRFSRSREAARMSAIGNFSEAL